MADMTLSDYAAMREIECQHGKGWGLSTAVWVLVAAVIIFAIVYNWTKTSNEKAQFATSLARLDGRIDCLEPDVRWAGQQLYAANDPDGYEGQIFTRWVGDLMKQDITIDWRSYV